MEDSKVGAHGEAKTTIAAADSQVAAVMPEEKNPNSCGPVEASAEQDQETESEVVPPPQSARTPFTNLSQVDADLALARTLQEQERAYMMLAVNGEGSDYGSWETGSYAHEDEDDFSDPHNGGEDDEDEDEDEDEDDFDDSDEENDDEDTFDAHAHANAGEDDNSPTELDPSAFPSDEAFARALQDAEDREMAARLLGLAGINDHEVEEIEDHGGISQPQDAWEEVDPDELSYEELIALGEVVGTESRGLSADNIASLPSVNYKMPSSQDGINDSCVICRLDYVDGDSLTVLHCKHSYHADCLNNWLQINKVCPVCSAEVSTSESR